MRHIRNIVLHCNSLTYLLINKNTATKAKVSNSSVIILMNNPDFKLSLCLHFLNFCFCHRQILLKNELSRHTP